MRAFLLVGLLALATLAVPAEASIPLPVTVTPRLETTTPSQECPDCVGVAAGAGVSLTNCMDCPAFGVGASAEREGKSTTVGARVCYSSLFSFCVIDEEATA